MNRHFVAAAAAFAASFTATSALPALADYTYSSAWGDLGTRSSSDGNTYRYWNQAQVTETNVGSYNDYARTYTYMNPRNTYLFELGAEARLFKDNGQLCRTSGMRYDYQEYPDGGVGYLAFRARRSTVCPTGYYYSYGKSARTTNSSGWAYYYTFKTDSLAMFN